MNRNEFLYLVKDLPDGGVKKACYIVREYIRHEIMKDLSHSAVTKEEYDEAVRILLAHSFKTSDNDTTIEDWYCEFDCNRNNGLEGFCKGEFQSSSKAKKLCKYYSDSYEI